jgi:hypothetical protein
MIDHESPLLFAVIARSTCDDAIQPLLVASGLLRGACQRAALCADPLARNDAAHHAGALDFTSL